MKLIVIFLLLAVQFFAHGETSSDKSSSFSNLCFAEAIQKYQDGKYTDDKQSSFVPPLELPVGKAAVFETLQEILTSETVKKGMEAFINLSKNRTVEDSDFFEAMQSVADEDKRDTGGVPQFVKNYLQTWCQNRRQADPGPGVILNRINSTHVILSQEEIVLLDYNTVGLKWYIPVKMVTGDNTTIWAWLEDNGKPKVVPYPESSSWLLVDSKLVPALHRPSIQEKLEVQLNRNCSVFSEAQRVKLIWGAFVFKFRQNLQYIGIHPFLNITRYISKERSQRVWKEYIETVPYYRYMSHPDFPIVGEYFNKQLDSALSAVIERIKTDKEEKSLKDYLFEEAVRRGSPLAVDMGKNALKEWKAQGELEEVKAEDLSLLLLAAGEDDLKYFYNPEKNYTIDEKDGRLSNLVKYVKDLKLYRRILQEALNDPPVYPLQKYNFPAKKEQVLLTFLDENLSKIPTEEIYYYLISFEFTSEKQLDKIREFVGKHPELFSKEEKQRLDGILDPVIPVRRRINLVENVIHDMVNWVSLQEQ